MIHIFYISIYYVTSFFIANNQIFNLIFFQQCRTNQRMMFAPPKLSISAVFSKLKEIAKMTGNAVLKLNLYFFITYLFITYLFITYLFIQRDLKHISINELVVIEFSIVVYDEVFFISNIFRFLFACVCIFLSFFSQWGKNKTKSNRCLSHAEIRKQDI